MLLYIRHGDDRGEDEYKHDRPLNARGTKKAAKAAKRLIEKYGHPDIVIVSPYRRAVETSDAMTASFVRSLEHRCDPRIAQRLSEKQRADPKLHPETRLQVDVTEDQDAFKRRVAEHFEEVRKQDGATWCITHQVVIEEIASNVGVKIPTNLDFLDHVVVLE